jgi:hypothetical protein
MIAAMAYLLVIDDDPARPRRKTCCTPSRKNWRSSRSSVTALP